jgi:hypothetical protein
MRILQDFNVAAHHRFQLSLDVQNLGNLINSGWGVRKVASAAATSPLLLVGAPSTTPTFNYTGPGSQASGVPNGTFIEDPSILSRWRAQIGLRYYLN